MAGRPFLSPDLFEEMIDGVQMKGPYYNHEGREYWACDYCGTKWADEMDAEEFGAEPSKNSDKGCWICNTYSDMDDEPGFFEMLKKEHEAHDLSAKLESIIDGKGWKNLVAEIDWYDEGGEIHYDYVMNEWGSKSSRVHEVGSFLLDISQQYVADKYGGGAKKAFANYPDGKIDVVDMGHTMVVEIPNVYDSERMNKLILTQIESDEWDAEEFGAESTCVSGPTHEWTIMGQQTQEGEGGWIHLYCNNCGGVWEINEHNCEGRKIAPEWGGYYDAEEFGAEGISEGRYMWKLRFEFDEGNISWDDDVLPLIKDYTSSWDSYGVGFGNVRVVVQSPREVVLQKLKADLDDHLGGYIHYGAEEFGADGAYLRKSNYGDDGRWGIFWEGDSRYRNYGIILKDNPNDIRIVVDYDARLRRPYLLYTPQPNRCRQFNNLNEVLEYLDDNPSELSAYAHEDGRMRHGSSYPTVGDWSWYGAEEFGAETFTEEQKMNLSKYIDLSDIPTPMSRRASARGYGPKMMRKKEHERKGRIPQRIIVEGMRRKIEKPGFLSGLQLVVVGLAAASLTFVGMNKTKN